MQRMGRIQFDPEVLAGKPVIRRTRLAVEFILELLAAGESEKEILTDYPGLTREHIVPAGRIQSHPRQKMAKRR